MHKLTEAELRFCEEYIVDFNATKAVIRVGHFKVKNSNSAGARGSLLLRKRGIKLYLEELITKRSNETKIDKAWVLRAAVKLFDRCMADGSGFDSSGASKALAIIGKHVDVRAFDVGEDASTDVTPGIMWGSKQDSPPPPLFPKLVDLTYQKISENVSVA